MLRSFIICPALTMKECNIAVCTGTMTPCSSEVTVHVHSILYVSFWFYRIVIKMFTSNLTLSATKHVYVLIPIYDTLGHCLAV